MVPIIIVENYIRYQSFFTNWVSQQSLKVLSMFSLLVFPNPVRSYPVFRKIPFPRHEMNESALSNLKH